MAAETIQLEEPKSMEIPLTRGYVAIVDAEDYERLAVRKWSAFVNPRSGAVYAVSRAGENCRQVYMHRWILGLGKWATGDPDVDHRNRNGIDNRKSNLRIVSRRENLLNRRTHRDNTSGYRGVSWSKQTHKWWARLCVRGQRVNLGYFDNQIIAAMAYDTAARSHDGADAQVNFPREMANV